MKPNIYPGKLIVAEGLDGSGKTMNLNLLKNWLEIEGYASDILKRKNSNLIAMPIDQAKFEKKLLPITYSLIHAADFSDILHTRIIPALTAGYIVLFNKYVYTSVAKDHLRGQSKEWIFDLYNFALQPDLVFYFKMPWQDAVEKITQEQKEKDYYDSGMDIGFGANQYISLKNYQAKLANEYDLLAKEFKFINIDATKPINNQQKELQQHIIKLLKKA